MAKELEQTKHELKQALLTVSEQKHGAELQQTLQQVMLDQERKLVDAVEAKVQVNMSKLVDAVEAKASTEQASRSATDELERRCEIMSKELAEGHRQSERMHSELQHLRAAAAEYPSKLEKLYAENVQLTRRVAQSSSAEQSNAEVQTMQMRMEDLRAALASAEARSSELEKQNSRSAAQLSDVSEQLVRRVEAHSKCKAENEMLREALQAAKATVDEYGHKIEEVSAELQSKVQDYRAASPTASPDILVELQRRSLADQSIMHSLDQLQSRVDIMAQNIQLPTSVSSVELAGAPLIGQIFDRLDEMRQQLRMLQPVSSAATAATVLPMADDESSDIKHAMSSVSTMLRAIRLGGEEAPSNHPNQDQPSHQQGHNDGVAADSMLRMSFEDLSHSSPSQAITDALRDGPKELIPIVLMALRRSEVMQRNLQKATERNEVLRSELQLQVEEKEKQLNMALSTLRRVRTLLSPEHTAHAIHAILIETQLQHDEKLSNSVDLEGLIYTVEEYVREHRAMEARMNETEVRARELAQTQCNALQQQLTAAEDELVHARCVRDEVSLAARLAEEQLEQAKVHAQDVKAERDELYRQVLALQESQARQRDEGQEKLNALAMQLAAEGAKAEGFEAQVAELRMVVDGRTSDRELQISKLSKTIEQLNADCLNEVRRCDTLARAMRTVASTLLITQASDGDIFGVEKEDAKIESNIDRLVSAIISEVNRLRLVEEDAKTLRSRERDSDGELVEARATIARLQSEVDSAVKLATAERERADGMYRSGRPIPLRLVAQSP